MADKGGDAYEAGEADEAGKVDEAGEADKDNKLVAQFFAIICSFASS